jgi:hypothetical protein
VRENAVQRPSEIALRIIVSPLYSADTVAKIVGFNSILVAAIRDMKCDERTMSYFESVFRIQKKLFR